MTEIETQKGKNASGSMSLFSIVMTLSGRATIRAARYGPKNVVTTVLLKAELAQSYIAQPRISFGLFFVGWN
jgi:hypothetical protein